jgi:hypothetical protein
MSHDRGDWHIDNARTWKRACRHIALYLWWAVDRGLGSDRHDAKKIAKSPTEYFISECDTKLWDEDFTAKGDAFTTAEYDKYLGKVSAYARTLGVGDYDVRQNATTKQYFFDLLDRRLAAWRKRAKKKKPAAKKKQPKQRR